MGDLSCLTAISRSKISAPISVLLKEFLVKGRVLDYGCGKGTDAQILGCDGYDPKYFPEFPSKEYDTIVCIYVLNVVYPEVALDIMVKIQGLLAASGVAYLAVRRDGDLPESGVIFKGQIQRDVRLPLPSIYERKGDFEIYRLDKDANLSSL